MCSASVFVFVRCSGLYWGGFFFFFKLKRLPIMMITLLCRVQCLCPVQWPQFNANMSLSCHHVTASPTSLLFLLLTHLFFMQVFIEWKWTEVEVAMYLWAIHLHTHLFKTLITVGALLIMTESAKCLLSWRFYIALYIFIVLSAYADTQMIKLTQRI